MAPDPHTVARVADGPWNLDALTTRLAELSGWRGPEEIGWTAAALVVRWRRRPRLAPERLVAEIAELLAERPGVRVRPDVPEPRWRWPVTPWSDLDALALGLDLRVGELDWFADPGGWLTRAPEGPLHHYRRRWTTSRAGAPRLLESPAPRLQELQRRVGRKVLAAIPVHDAAHGYVRGRSPHTLAAAHAGTPLVVRLDLEGFFAHVTGERVAGLLRTAGYPAAVAAALAGLLVTTTPRAVLRGAPPAVAPTGWEPRRRLLDRLAAPHLPQGAPTSPVTANLLTHRLDRRLAGLASAVGASYGRYADDLVFSEATLPAHGLIALVTTIAEEEGFRVRRDKTRVLPAHRRQVVTGLVVNTRPAASTTPCARCCTTARRRGPLRRTTTRTRRSASTCSAVSPGSGRDGRPGRRACARCSRPSRGETTGQAAGRSW